MMVNRPVLSHTTTFASFQSMKQLPGFC
jgi:hypothetical protein